ncbi:MAG: class I SAM-dependent methyltransferase [Candidatus Eremiobacteraeota bacterium]|nr:class I SAM-dependent methyltransferase [Candidatus Eremiobacteraeota bacterium]
MPENWDPQLQRSSLRGFARIRAILWERSLGFYEWLCLARFDWWWKLRKAVRAAFRDCDPIDLANRYYPELVYGETPAVTVYTLLDSIELPAALRLVDLGCGRGWVSLTAASMGYSALGIDLVPEYLERARQVARQLDLAAEFVEGDLAELELPEGELYWVSATALPESVKQHLAQALSGRPAGTLVVCQDWSPGSPLERIWQVRLPVSFGVSTFEVWRVSGESDAAQ